MRPKALAGDVEGDLPFGIGHRFDHGHVLEEVDRAGVFVVAGLELASRTERRLRGLQDRRFHGLDQDLPVDSLLLGDLVDDVTQAPFKPGFRCCH